MRHLRAFALLLALLAPLEARAQAIGGNASLAVSTTSANVAIPASASAFPALFIVPAPGTTTEIFYKFGTSNAVTATNTSPSLPFGGICYDSLGPNTYLAALAATGTATVRITQLSRCPPFANNVPVIANPLPTAGSPSSSSAFAISHGVVTSLGTFLVAKASAGNLYGFNCTAITGGAAGYCVAINATTVPSTGAISGVLDACYFAAGAGGCSLARPNFPANYSTGIVILVTSAVAPFTYTTGVDTAFISADFQ